MMEINYSEESDLLLLPVEVLDKYIFSFLPYSDLLRMRRVCKYLKSLSNTFILTNFQSHFREINQTNYTFQHYLHTNIPTTSIYLNNSSPSIFQDSNIPTFLNLHGNQIASLKIKHFATLISEHELHFLSNLPNLLHLEITFVDASQRDCSKNIKLVNGQPVFVPDSPFPLLREKSPFPPNFKNLKTLKLNSVQGSSPNDYGYPWDFLEFCENLQHFKHPLYILEGGYGFYNHHEGNLGWMSDFIKRRINGNGLPNLGTYDMEHFLPNQYSTRFINFVPLCLDNNVKLLNVPHALLAQHPEFSADLAPEISGCIKSLINLPWCAVTKEMSNLEKLVIEKTSATDWKNINDGEAKQMVAQWRVLKILEINIDSGEIVTPFGDERRDMEFANPGIFDRMSRKLLSKDVLDFLFYPKPEKRYDELRDLALRFSVGVFENHVEPIPLPNVRFITETCGFVTKLTLENWQGTDEQVVEFWKGLRLLEEVVLENCEKIGDKAFVEDDGWENPEFLNLEKLRKLSLKGLDKMPKITDLVFKKVFRKLKIQQFCLTSETPVKSVTKSGIESLLTGNYNDSVEKFLFTDWSLNGVSEGEFNQLKLKFRASHMF